MLHCSLLWTSCLRFLTKCPAIPQQLYKTASRSLSAIAELLVFFSSFPFGVCISFFAIIVILPMDDQLDELTGSSGSLPVPLFLLLNCVCTTLYYVHGKIKYGMVYSMWRLSTRAVIPTKTNLWSTLSLIFAATLPPFPSVLRPSLSWLSRTSHAPIVGCRGRIPAANDFGAFWIQMSAVVRLEWVSGESLGSKQAYRVIHQPVSVVSQYSLMPGCRTGWLAEISADVREAVAH